MTPFKASVSRYTAITVKELSRLIEADEAQQRAIQSRLCAMRKAQRIQRMGKPPQHTKGESK